MKVFISIFLTVVLFSIFYFLFSDIVLAQSISDFGSFGSAMQILPWDNNSPEQGGNVEEYIRLHQEMGFGWDRANIAWSSVEIAKKEYDWQEVDSRLEKMFAAGIKPSIIVYGGNNYDGEVYWDAKVPGFDGLAGTREEYLAFVKKTVERYDGDGISDASFINSQAKVKFWEGWNEPVQFAHISVAQATELHQQYYQAVKDVCSDCYVISPGFAYMERIQEFMEIDGARSFDLLSVHSNYHLDEDPDESMYLNILRQDDSFEDWGLDSRPWWISEFGPNSSHGYDYAFRTARMYIVGLYQTFHNRLSAVTNWPREGRDNEIINGRLLRDVL